MKLKSHFASALLTLIFGPLGLLYSAPWQALVLTVAYLLAIPMSLDIEPVVALVAGWLLPVVLGAYAVNKRNNYAIELERKEDRKHTEIVSAINSTSTR